MKYNMRESTPFESVSEASSTWSTANSQKHLQHYPPSNPRLLTRFVSIVRIKRAAHREAWYSKSLNPFARWRPCHDGDVEAPDLNRAVEQVTSEPTDNIQNATTGCRTITDEKVEMSTGREGGTKPERSSDKTAVDSQSTGRPPSQEQSARLRFIARFNPRGREDNVHSTNSTGLSGLASEGAKSSKKFTFVSQLRATLFNSWINILLLAAPVGIVLYFLGMNPVVIFVVNFIAIIPLAALISYATEEIAMRVGETLGGLLNASFGNAVELIVSIIACVHQEFLIVQTSLIGSMLSNLLLVMGMCFFFGGLRREEQHFNVTVALTAASLLALAVASIIVPSAFDLWTATSEVPIAQISRGTSVILLVVYGCYLFFQLKTHSALFNEESEKVAMKHSKYHIPEGAIQKGLVAAGGIGAAQGRSHAVSGKIPPPDEIMNKNAYELGHEKEDEPQLNAWVAAFTLAAATAVTALCAEAMVSSIDAVTGTNGLSPEFVGLILLPIVGNAAEHATAVTVACKDKMDLAIGVAVGSSMQIALLVLPLIVVLGWILGYDKMNLSFDGFQVAVLFVSVLLVNYLIGDGKSNWLEGVLLQCLYVIIAVSAYFYP